MMASQLVVRPMLAIVGARLLGRGRPGGVIVATPVTLAVYLRSLPSSSPTSRICSRSSTSEAGWLHG